NAEAVKQEITSRLIEHATSLVNVHKDRKTPINLNPFASKDAGFFNPFANAKDKEKADAIADALARATEHKDWQSLHDFFVTKIDGKESLAEALLRRTGS